MTTATAVQTILVVDDDDASRTGLADLLNGDGYRVALAANGIDARHYLRRCPAPDLMILDMSSLDSWRLLKDHRCEGTSIPIIMTTSTSVGSVTQQWAKSVGAVSFLRKPVDLQVLLKHVRDCLGQ